MGAVVGTGLSGLSLSGVLLVAEFVPAECGGDPVLFGFWETQEEGGALGDAFAIGSADGAFDFEASTALGEDSGADGERSVRGSGTAVASFHLGGDPECL